jgi:pentatricopeptide repeat protein
LQVVKDKGLPIDVYCYTAAIESCAKTGMWERALELLNEMESVGVEPSAVTCSVTITACGNGGEWQKSLDLLGKMRRKDMKINLITYNAAIAALSKGAKMSVRNRASDYEPLWIKAMDLLKQMKQDGIDPDGFSFCSAISCCGAEGRWQEALDLMDVMRNGGPNTQPNKIAYTCAIDSCGRAGQVDHALRLFQQMKDQGLSADRVAYNTLFSALRVARRADPALELWEEMLGIKQSSTMIATTPDIITVTNVLGAISAHASVEQLDRVDKIFAGAVERGIVLSDRLDSANEFDLSGMSLPVARAACRYVLNRLKSQGHHDLLSLTLITGVGKGTRRLGMTDVIADGLDENKGWTSLREHVQKILLTDFSPPIQSTVPRLAQGTVVIERETLLNWL